MSTANEFTPVMMHEQEQVAFTDRRLDPSGLMINYVDVSDGYEGGTRDKLNRRIVQGTLDGYESYLRSHPDVTIDSPNNPARDYLDKIPTIAAWKQMMPSAMALYPLQRPDEKRLPDGTPVDALSRNLFRHSKDAIGIRTRAKIMTNLTVEHFKDSDEADIKWVSLACGAAVPVLDAVDGLRQTDNSKNVHLTLVDYDPEALNFAEYLAGKQGLEADADYSIESANLIRELIVSDAFVQRHGAESYDMVDMLGIFEYFDKEMSAKMLHNAFALVKEGGQLVLGNMLVTHDNLQLNQRAIGWPSIKPRSFEEIAEIIELAGIPVEQSEAYVPKDGVYAVVSIEKSAPAPRPFPSRIAETALRNSR